MQSFRLVPFHLFSFASGALALIYEILWMRRFSTLFGATAPAAAATLSAFFLGIAVGNAVLGRRSARWLRPLRAYALLEFGIAAGALLVAPAFAAYDHLCGPLYALISGAPSLFLHPAPRKVAFLGRGTGITAGAALVHPVECLVALEIVPEVIRAARDHFADSNHNIASDPRAQILPEDARNFLRGSGRKFDVIVGDLVVPWRPGESSLFSLEHFRATWDALLPGGIFCQWAPLYQLSDESFRIVIATFPQAYPEATLWRGDFRADQPAVALIGRRDPGPLDVAAIDRQVRYAAPARSRTNPYLSEPAGLWIHFVGAFDPHDAMNLSPKRNQDSRPWLELLSSAAHLEIHGGEGDERPVPGRALAALYRELRARPQGSALAQLDPEHLRWQDAGAGLWEASVVAAEGNRGRAQAKAMESFAALPASLQAAVLGAPLQPSSAGASAGH